MKQRLFSFAMAVCMLCCLTMTSCAAQEAPAPGGGEGTSGAALPGAFADVPADAAYAQAVDWCKEEGLMAGVGGGRFDPDGTLTRAMLATVLYRAAGSPAVSGGPDFSDVKSGAWYTDAVVWAAERKLIQGYGNHVFGGNDPVTREQLAVILGRYAGEDPAWTGDPALAVPATRAEVAVALYQRLNTEDAPVRKNARVLVAYFSATNTTRPLAEYAADILSADLYEIVPEEPYTEADLAYYTGGRADREQDDPSARPAIAGSVEDMAQYDVVFIGYPIWHGQPPRIISTFMESYGFAGKTIVPFCTSHSSGYSDSTIKPLAPDANWLPGRRFASGTSKETMQTWIDTLELPKQEEATVKQITLSFNGHTYPATLEDNAAAVAFAELLQSKGGSMTISMNEYGGWEKVGPLGQTLPSENAQTTTAVGDFVLYSGNQIVLFYGSNTWSYTRLGRIDDPSGLREALGDGDVEITFRLAEASAE